MCALDLKFFDDKKEAKLHFWKRKISDKQLLSDVHEAKRVDRGQQMLVSAHIGQNPRERRERNEVK